MSTLNLYDTSTREVGVFTPIKTGEVSIYVCGATVQASPHIGHIRSAVNFDVLRRWLIQSGYAVTFIRNVTDIDDKILQKAAQEQVQWWAHAMKYEREFTAAFAALNVLPPTYEPRATGHITQMIELMQKLIDNGSAYAPGNGDVYLEVRTLKRYLTLSGQRIDDLMPAADVDAVISMKRDPRDFALWKAAKPGEPSWPTPWGAGRPGWHLECSAMAYAYLGESFDIHGGGLDLIFPHHENEIAQSEAAGYGFAKRWLHNAWVTQSGEKIRTNNVVWAAGVKGNSIEGFPKEVYAAGNRLKVNAFNQVDGLPNIFAVGDIALMNGDPKFPNGHPQVAQPAIQQGKLLAKNLLRILRKEEPVGFVYKDLGSMATVGRHLAVVDLPFWKFQGAFAWYVWMFVHLMAILGVKNKVMVFINWLWNYITYDQSLRLIIKPKVKQ